MTHTSNITMQIQLFRNYFNLNKRKFSAMIFMLVTFMINFNNFCATNRRFYLLKAKKKQKIFFFSSLPNSTRQVSFDDTHEVNKKKIY